MNNKGIMAFATALAFSSFFLPGTKEAAMTVSVVSPFWLSALSALLLLGIIAVFLTYVNSNCLQYSSKSMLLYGSYLLVVFSYHSAIVLTEYHIAVFLLLLSFYSMVRYVNEEQLRISYAFVAGLAISVASVLLPPLIWAVAYIFLNGIFKRNHNILRYILAFLSAVLLPWVYICAWGYIFSSEEAMAIAEGFFPSLAFSGIKIPEASAVVYGFAGLCVFIALRSVLMVLAQWRNKSMAQKNAFGLSAALSVLLLATYFLYGSALSPLFGIVAALPASFCVYALLAGGSRVETGLYVMLLSTYAVVLRVLQFLSIC